MAERAGQPGRSGRRRRRMWGAVCLGALLAAGAVALLLRRGDDTDAPGPGAAAPDEDDGARPGDGGPPASWLDHLVPDNGPSPATTAPAGPGAPGTTGAPAPPRGPGAPGATTPTPGGSDEMTEHGGRWRPTRGMSWQWQLDGGPIDMSVEAEVYDVDLFETSADEVAALHDRGRRVICYFSAGSWEPYRPDAGDYPDEVIGGPVEGWPDERWLDVRRLDLLRPRIAARLDLCAAKGADGAEPDWMDNHLQETGWDITAEHQLAFNLMVAELAHERGLAIGLKNDLGQVAELADTFDFAVVEQCAEFGECGELAPFLDRGKPVFHAEYDLPVSRFCAESRRLGLSSIRKRLDLGPWRETC